MDAVTCCEHLLCKVKMLLGSTASGKAAGLTALWKTIMCIWEFETPGEPWLLHPSLQDSIGKLCILVVSPYYIILWMECSEGKAVARLTLDTKHHF